MQQGAKEQNLGSVFVSVCFDGEKDVAGDRSGKGTKMVMQRIGKTGNYSSSSLLVLHRGCLDHEVPDRKGNLRVDHLEVAVHPEIKRRVACQELKTIMVAVVSDLIP